MSRAAEIGVYSFSETARRALQVWTVAQFWAADIAEELRAWHALDEPSVDNSAAMASILADILDALGEPNVMEKPQDE
jgi:hypothetical protein